MVPPGLGRPLKRDRDFEKSLGQDVELKLYKAQDGQKEYTGCLQAYTKDTVTLEIEDRECVFQRSDIALIRLAIDF